MLIFACFFAVGALIFHQLPSLPEPVWLGAGLVLLVIVSYLPWRLVSVALIVGFCWSHAYALMVEPAEMPVPAQVIKATVEGKIVELPQIRPDTTRIIFRVRALEVGDVRHIGDWRVRLSWRAAPALSPGEHWRLPVRLRAAHGFASPGSWDYEGWLYHQGIRYTGYVSRDGKPMRGDAGTCCALDRMRFKISRAVAELEGSTFSLGVIRALAVADRSGMSTDDKALFRNTGTSHLMAVSGLHIGLAAGLGMLVISGIWRAVPPFCSRLPGRVAGAAGGLFIAAVYAGLAGMGLPTQRALIMLCVFAGALMMRRRAHPLQGLALALVAVLAWHPPSIVDAGLWLSFVAVLVIIAAMAWGRDSTRVRQAVRIQISITLGLWPVLVVFGLPVSSVAVVANLLVVPLFGLVIVPWCLIGVAVQAVHPPTGGWLLEVLGHVLDGVHEALLVFERLGELLPLGGAGDLFAVVAVSFALILFLQPPGWPLRWLAVPLIGIVWLPRAPTIPNGDFQFDLLDVGQGLSAVVTTREHSLVFDTGAEYPSGFSTAKAVVIPFLQHIGRRRVDRLILSHGDRDHAGGVHHIQAHMQVNDILSGEPERVGGARPCVVGQHWEWDGVSFEMLHPGVGENWSGNNASCVLRVTNEAGSLLLSGDIEAAVERRLVEAGSTHLRSRIVVAPHHGSTSSSSAEFISASDPEFVLYPAGWANRYGFPAAEVDRRWRDAGVKRLNTAQSGSIGFRFQQDGGLVGPSAYRQDQRRYWWHDAGSVDGHHAVSSDDRKN